MSYETAIMVNLTDDGKIMLYGNMIGHIDWNENFIIDIMIDKEFRNQGIGTEVISQLVDMMNEEGYDIVRTTTVVSGSAETVLRKNGFIKSTLPVKGVSDEILEMSKDREKMRWYNKL